MTVDTYAANRLRGSAYGSVLVKSGLALRLRLRLF